MAPGTRSSSSLRSTPSSRRSSSSASRPVVSIAANASRASSGRFEREPACAGGLDGHGAQRVGDDVVQLAGDPRALVDHGAVRGVRAVPFEPARLLAQRPVQRGARAQQPADEHRRPDGHHGGEDPARDRRVVVVGRRGHDAQRRRERDADHELPAGRAQAEPVRGHERGGEREEQLLVVDLREHRQQRDGREHRQQPGERVPAPGHDGDAERDQDQRRERPIGRPGVGQQRQLELELEDDGEPDQGGETAMIGHVLESDVRLPVCPRKQGRCGCHPEG